MQLLCGLVAWLAQQISTETKKGAVHSLQSLWLLERLSAKLFGCVNLVTT
jgi:hypothetical protein